MLNVVFGAVQELAIVFVVIIVILSHQVCRASLAIKVPEEQGDRTTLCRGSGVPTFSLANPQSPAAPACSVPPCHRVLSPYSKFPQPHPKDPPGTDPCSQE